MSNEWWAKDSSYNAYAKKQIRRYDLSTVLTAFSILAIVMGGMVWTVVGADPNRVTTGQFESNEHPTSIGAVLNQCGDIFTFDPPSHHYGVYNSDEVIEQLGEQVPEKELPLHPMIVPVYGYMTEEARLTETMYSFANAPDRSEVLRALYDGQIVLWYSPALTDAEKGALSTYLNTSPHRDRLVAIEWVDEALPLGRQYAFSTWNVSQSCLRWDSTVLDDFVDFVDTHPEFRPDEDTPPDALLTDEGQLHEIDPPR